MILFETFFADRGFRTVREATDSSSESTGPADDVLCLVLRVRAGFGMDGGWTSFSVGGRDDPGDEADFRGDRRNDGFVLVELDKLSAEMAFFLVEGFAEEVAEDELRAEDRAMIRQ